MKKMENSSGVLAVDQAECWMCLWDIFYEVRVRRRRMWNKSEMVAWRWMARYRKVILVNDDEGERRWVRVRWGY